MQPTEADQSVMLHLQHELAELYRQMGQATAHLHRNQVTALAASDHVALAKLALLGPIRLSALAEASGLDVSTTSRRISSLEERGLVVRTKDPDDARATLLSPSEAGLATLQRHLQARIEIILGALSTWEPNDRADLARLLAQLNESIAAAPTRHAPLVTTSTATSERS